MRCDQNVRDLEESAAESESDLEKEQGKKCCVASQIDTGRLEVMMVTIGVGFLARRWHGKIFVSKYSRTAPYVLWTLPIQVDNQLQVLVLYRIYLLHLLTTQMYQASGR